MTVLDPEKLFEESVRPALASIGWGSGPDDRRERIETPGTDGVIYRYEVGAARPFVVGVLAKELGSEGERWVGNIGYLLRAPLALLAAPGHTRLVAPHMIAAASKSGLQSHLDMASPLAPLYQSGADPLVLRTEPADVRTAILRVGVNPEQVAEATEAGGRFRRKGFRPRVPVDEALMLHLIRIRERLIREESLDQAKQAEYLRLDRSLLRLVGTLLFLRTLEHNRSITLERTLWEIARGPDVLPGIHDAADEVARRIGRAAVPLDDHAWRSEAVLRDLIRGLYFDETQLAPIDFRLLDEDILGQLYQEYLQYLLTDRRKTSQLRLLESEDRIPLKVRRSLGIYYTPRSVVDIIREQVDLHWTAPDIPKILEPACGAAAFLRPMAGWLAGRWQDASPEQLAENLVGIDRDPRAVTLAQQTLGRTFASLYDRVPAFSVYQGDFLATSPDGAPLVRGEPATEAFDVVVGNPPFLSYRALKALSPRDAEQYRSTFGDTVGGETNLAVYFIIQALRVLRPNGLLGFVVPRRLLRGSDAQIRRTMLEHAELLSVVDLGLKSVFRGADETTALVIMRKRSHKVPAPSATSAPAVFALHYRDDQASLITRGLVGRARRSELEGTVLMARCHATPDGPWMLLTPTGERARQALTSAGTPLREMIVSSYGVDMMSGKGQTLLFDRVEQDEGVVETRSRYLKRAISIDSELLRDAVEADAVERYREIAGTEKVSVFHPFRRNGMAIPEAKLLDPAGSYSASAALLRELEPVLRSVRGARKVPEWYAPAASRVNAPWHAERNRGRFADSMLVSVRFSMIPKVTAVPATLVPVGSLFAFMVRREYEAHLDRLLVFMNSSLANWYAIMAAPAFSRAGLLDRSKVTFRDFRAPDSFLNADLDDIAAPLDQLRANSGDLTIAQILHAEQLLDNWVYRAFDIDDADREAIRYEAEQFTGNALYASARSRALGSRDLEEIIGKHVTPRSRRL